MIVTANFIPEISDSISTDRGNNKGPNVIIIGIDSLRYDFLKKEYVPNVASFFEKAIVFPEAFTPLARTYPSWMSLLTGRYPAHSGVRYNLINRKLLKGDLVTLPSYLKRFGYFTAHAIDESRFCNIKHQDGFDMLIHPVTGAPDFILGKFHDFTLLNLFMNNYVGRHLFPIINRNRAVAHLYRGDSFVQDLASALDVLEGKERFFLAVHFCMPHWPFVSAGIGKGKIGKNWLSPEKRYQHMLKRADAQFAGLMKAIASRGLLDRSLVIVLSDHGESFYPFWGHGTDLRDPAQNRIVLALRPPDIQAPAKLSGPVSMVDLYPTILSWLNLPYPKGYELDGMDILSSNGKRGGPLFLETGFHLFHANGTGFTLQEMIRQGLEYYEIDPDTGLITVKEEFHDSIICSKQFGAIQDDLLLVYQPENRRQQIELIHWRDGKALDRQAYSQVVLDLERALSFYLNGGLFMKSGNLITQNRYQSAQGNGDCPIKNQ